MYEKEEIWKILKQLPKEKLSHEEIQNGLYEVSCKRNEDINIKLESLFKESYSFQKGIITFIDFLGWKGLWLNEQEPALKNVSDIIKNIEIKL